MKHAKPLAAVWLGLLMLLSAVTEGFGILLLVPMLQALGGSEGESTAGRWLAATGLQLSLAGLLAIFVGLVMFRSAVNAVLAQAGHRFQVGIIDGLRNRAWEALLNCEWRVVSTMRHSDTASLLISNVDRIGNGMGSLVSAIAALVTLLGIGAAAMAISPMVALITATGAIAILIAHRGLNRRAARLGQRLSEAYRNIHGGIGESLNGLRIVKSLGREGQMAASIADGFKAMRAAEREYLRDSGLAKFLLEGSGAVLVACMVWLAVSRWGKGPAEILPLVVLFGRALPLFSLLQGTWQNWAHARPAIDDVAAVIAQAEAAREPDDGGEAIPRPRQAIVLEHVSVRFQERNAAALDTVDLVIPALGITALTGPSGAGKSTLADLAGGLIAPDAGQVRIDDVVLGDRLKRTWRRSVAYVQQEPVLFTGSIRDNLVWAQPDASEAQLHDALARASASFVESLPGGLDTLVGEGGRQLSGGERQRIVLARALLRRPSLLILDEATSALDAENEAAIAEALGHVRGEMAVLIICHRGELQNLADRVVRLEHGKIVATEDRTKILV